jgi:hypothetical protein
MAQGRLKQCELPASVYRPAGAVYPTAGGLLVRVVMMMVVTMVMVPVNYHHNLRLRGIRSGKAEDKSQCEQSLFHTSCSHFPAKFTELL